MYLCLCFLSSARFWFSVNDTQNQLFYYVKVYELLESNLYLYKNIRKTLNIWLLKKNIMYE